MSRVVHFEIQADDLDRAKKFYGDVFGWTFTDYSEFTGSPYWGVTTGEGGAGIDGGLLHRGAPRPAAEQGANAYVCSIEIDDYDAYEGKILKSGGEVTLPKTALPGMAWQGYYLDTEGNTFGLHQPDPEAK